jgi:hypothetical protein
MDTKDIQLDCPCCQSRLEVDVRSGKVLRWRPKGDLGEPGKPVVRESDWGSASQKVNQRMDAAADKFDQSLSREKNRTRDLDELFRKANEKLGRNQDS